MVSFRTSETVQHDRKKKLKKHDATSCTGWDQKTSKKTFNTSTYCLLQYLDHFTSYKAAQKMPPKIIRFGTERLFGHLNCYSKLYTKQHEKPRVRSPALHQ